MAEIYTNVSLDTVKYNNFVPFAAKQLDTGSRHFIAKILNNGQAVHVPATDVVRCNFLSADGTPAANAGSVNADGTVNIDIPDTVLATSGTVKCSVSMTGDDNKLSTLRFTFYVEGTEEDEDAELGDRTLSYVEQLEQAISLLSMRISALELRVTALGG